MVDKQPKTEQDLSKTMEQYVATLHEVDHRLQRVRNDLATLIGRTGPTPAMPPWAGGPPSFEGAPGTPFPGLGMLGSFGVSPGGAVGGLPAGFVSPLVTGQSYLPYGGYSAPLRQETARSTRELRQVPPVVRTPAVNVLDDGNEYVVQVELPGVRKEDLELLSGENAIHISARAMPGPEEGVLVVGERVPVAYRRTVYLPSEVSTTKAKASLKDGILTLRVPKEGTGGGLRPVDVAYG